MPYSGPSSGAPIPGAPGSNLPGGVPVYGSALPVEPQSHKHPLGAIVLIIIGVMLLLHTLGVFEDEWISRAWPVAIIGIGAWLLYRRTRDTTGGSGRGGSL